MSILFSLRPYYFSWLKPTRMNKILLATSLLFLTAQLKAQWTSDPAVNTPLATGTASQSLRKAVPDGSGGTYVVWEESTFDQASQTNKSRILAQHLNSSGMTLWGNGITVSDPAKNTEAGEVISDNNGGFIVTWDYFEYDSQNNRISTSYDVYAQRINSNGQSLWTAGGLAVTADPGYQSTLEVTNFGDGGVVVGYLDSGIKLKLVRGDGSIAGSEIVLSTNPDAWIERLITGNDELSVIFSIENDNTDTNDYYIQRYDSQGSPVFGASGQLFLSTTWEPEVDLDNEWIVSDGQGGIFFLLMEEEVNNRLRLQHLSSQGTLSYPNSGIIVDNDTFGDAMLAADGQGGVVAGWTDTRNGQTGFYAQRYSLAGASLWPQEVAVLASEAQELSSSPVAEVMDDASFVFLLPGILRNSERLLVGQKVSSAGNLVWDPQGLVISSLPGYKFDPSIVENNNNIVAVWSNSPNGNERDVYAQGFSQSGVLPVHLLYFTASYKNQAVILKWETQTETNSDYFEVERSLDGKSFTTVARVAAAGNSISKISYSVNDQPAGVSSEILYYRLKQADKNGDITYSNPSQVKIRGLQDNIVSIYPNPTSNLLHIKMSSAKQAGYRYQLKDLNGRNITQNALGSEETLDLNTYPSGVYILEIRNNQETISKKIIKQ